MRKRRKLEVLSLNFEQLMIIERLAHKIHAKRYERFGLDLRKRNLHVPERRDRICSGTSFRHGVPLIRAMGRSCA